MHKTSAAFHIIQVKVWENTSLDETRYVTSKINKWFHVSIDYKEKKLL